MYSPHLLPAGAIIDYPVMIPDPSDLGDGLTQIDTASYYRVRLESQKERELKAHIEACRVEAANAARKLQDAEYDLWRFQNPGKTPLDWLYSR